VPPPVFSWTGPYVGGQIGYGWGTSNFRTNIYDPATNAFFLFSNGRSPSGAVGGAHVGYQYQINQFVLGLEGSVDGTSLQSSATVPFPNTLRGGVLTANTNLDVVGTIRGKIGYAWDRVLIYGTGGVAFGGFSSELTFISVTGPGTAYPVPANVGGTRVGWTTGGGLQYAVTNNWWVFAEYRYTNFGSINFDSGVLRASIPQSAFFNGSRQIRGNQVQAGFSYRFDLTPPAPVVAKY
jgi:outer membrane immunogenic protein